MRQVISNVGEHRRGGFKADVRYKRMVEWRRQDVTDLERETYHRPALVQVDFVALQSRFLCRLVGVLSNTTYQPRLHLHRNI